MVEPSVVPGSIRRGARQVASAAPLILALAVLLAAVARWGGHRADGSTAKLAEAFGSASAEGPVLLFAFQAADCPTFGTLVQGWEELERSGEAHVIGVMLGRPARDRDVGPPSLGFPLRPELAGQTERLLFRLGYHRTPVSVLLDADGRVRLALAAPRAPTAQLEMARLVREHAQQLRAERQRPSGADG